MTLKRKLKLLLLVNFLIVKFSGAFANTGGKMLVVPVGEAQIVKDSIYFERPVYKKGYKQFSVSERNAVSEVFDLLVNDFSFYRKIFEVKKGRLESNGNSKSSTYDYWKKKKINYLVRSAVLKRKKKVNYFIEVFDIRSKQLKMSKTIYFNIKKLRNQGHSLANEIYRSIIMKESIFNSRIVFVSDRTSQRKKIFKELYIMDFDGGNVKRLTGHMGTVISPAISNDKSKIVYSLIPDIRSVRTKNKRRNIRLYLYDLKTKRSTLISNRVGLNSGAVFLPDDEHIALTLSYVGNSEIYIMNLKTKSLRRLTEHFATDVDPSISYDGTLMAFLSGRAGKAMIYTMSTSGKEKNVKRISFVGKFNATPRFSPNGKEIVFSSWLNKSFDIFKINSNGTGLYRLTKNFGSNEDPTFSNDGQFVAFTSQRVLSRYKSVQNIYIMDTDGEIIKKVTSKIGNCISPRWSK